ncbi:MAG: hypothetical protein AAGP08_00070 [Pseudomonadota bacterium]
MSKERPTSGGSYTRAKTGSKLTLRETTKPAQSRAEKRAKAEQRRSSEAVAHTQETEQDDV